MSKNKEPLTPLTPAERLAQAALRGFFGDSLGFKDMSEGLTKRAANAVQKALEAKPEEKS